MSVALRKLDGVRSVDVHLDDGTATMELAPGNHVRIEQVREVIRKNGFTPRAAHVRVTGKLVQRNGRAALEVAGTDEVLLLDLHGVSGPAPRDGAVALAGTIEEARANDEATMQVDHVER